MGRLPDAVVRKLPRYPDVPAILLVRLAVDTVTREAVWASASLLHGLSQRLDAGCLLRPQVGQLVA